MYVSKKESNLSGVWRISPDELQKEGGCANEGDQREEGQGIHHEWAALDLVSISTVRSIARMGAIPINSAGGLLSVFVVVVVLVAITTVVVR